MGQPIPPRDRGVRPKLQGNLYRGTTTPSTIVTDEIRRGLRGLSTGPKSKGPTYQKGSTQHLPSKSGGGIYITVQPLESSQVGQEQAQPISRLYACTSQTGRKARPPARGEGGSLAPNLLSTPTLSRHLRYRGVPVPPANRVSRHNHTGDRESGAKGSPKQSPKPRRHSQQDPTPNPRPTPPTPVQTIQHISSAGLPPQTLQRLNHGSSAEAEEGQLHSTEGVQADRTPQHPRQDAGGGNSEPTGLSH
jgi:hypothetical protein